MDEKQGLNPILSFVFSLSIFIIIGGCSFFDKPLTKALTTSANIRIEKMDNSKAIIKYDRGALIESNGEAEAAKAMAQYCSSRNYKILISGERVSGEKKWTKTIVFECVDVK